MKFKILHTNDIHGNFENFAKIVTKIKEIKDDSTLILDAGDFLDFSKYEVIGTNGDIALELLSEAKYDGITIGNNEALEGISILEKLSKKSKIPFLCCNLLKSNNKELEGINKFIIIKKQGIRFLIIGVSLYTGIAYDILGYQSCKITETIESIINYNKDKYDMCILLNHIGSKNDEYLADKIDGIDIIISAHDHKIFNNVKIVNNTIINSAGEYGEYLGLIELEYKNNKISFINSEIINTSSIKVCEDTITIIEKNKKKALDALNIKICNITKPLNHNIIKECSIGNLIADGLKDYFKTDIGLINSGIVNGGLDKGIITEKKLIDIYQSKIKLATFKIKGKYLKEALKLTLNPKVCLSSGKAAGFFGKYLGRLHVSGMKIMVSKNEFNCFVDDKLLEDDKYYYIASTDYLQRGYGYKSLVNNEDVTYFNLNIKDILQCYLPEQEFINKAVINRWIESTLNN